MRLTPGAISEDCWVANDGVPAEAPVCRGGAGTAVAYSLASLRKVRSQALRRPHPADG